VPGGPDGGSVSDSTGAGGGLTDEAGRSGKTPSDVPAAGHSSPRSLLGSRSLSSFCSVERFGRIRGADLREVSGLGLRSTTVGAARTTGRDSRRLRLSVCRDITITRITPAKSIMTAPAATARKTRLELLARLRLVEAALRALCGIGAVATGTGFTAPPPGTAATGIAVGRDAIGSPYPPAPDGPCGRNVGTRCGACMGSAGAPPPAAGTTRLRGAGRLKLRPAVPPLPIWRSYAARRAGSHRQLAAAVTCSRTCAHSTPRGPGWQLRTLVSARLAASAMRWTFVSVGSNPSN
jgi:hypothetical protein